MRIKHFGIFQNGMKKLDWEILRNSKNEEPYYLPNEKVDYLSKVDVNEPSSLAQLIIEEISKCGQSKIFSIGCGIGALEYQLKKFSNYTVVISDNNDSVTRLKQFAIFDGVFRINALLDEFPISDSYVVIFPRIDTEFNDDELNQIFAKCHRLGVRNICFIPAELLNFKKILIELRTLFISIIKRNPRVFCGYIRSIRDFKKIFAPYYKISFASKKKNRIYFLEPM